MGVGVKRTANHAPSGCYAASPDSLGGILHQAHTVLHLIPGDITFLPAYGKTVTAQHAAKRVAARECAALPRGALSGGTARCAVVRCAVTAGRFWKWCGVL